MKKAFVSIYVLLILLVFGLTITFIYKENDTNYDISESLYNKKIALFEAESVLNMIIEEKNNGNEIQSGDILRNFEHKSKIEIFYGTHDKGGKEAEGEKVIKEAEGEKVIKEAEEENVINVSALYQGARSNAILNYEKGENDKIKIIYKRVY